eukprot:gene11455-12809_t
MSNAAKKSKDDVPADLNVEVPVVSKKAAKKAKKTAAQNAPLQDVKKNGEIEDSSSDSEPDDEDKGCPVCGKDYMGDSARQLKHNNKCARKVKAESAKKMTPFEFIEVTLKSDWLPVGDDPENRTLIPPIEIDQSGNQGYSCQWGCVTKTTKIAQSFRGKATFMEHIASHHPELRICIETPPQLVSTVGGNATKGRRFIIQESDVL